VGEERIKTRANFAQGENLRIRGHGVFSDCEEKPLKAKCWRSVETSLFRGERKKTKRNYSEAGKNWSRGGGGLIRSYIESSAHMKREKERTR